jgi:hypothetical protein
MRTTVADDRSARASRRHRHILVAALLGLVPITTLVGGGGCGVDDGDAFGPPYVAAGDPFGAEISVTVVGRGRVTTSLPGIDCPSSCFTKLFVPRSTTKDGATDSVTLRATPMAGARFVGWSFDPTPIGTRGGGPPTCNPVMRPGIIPPGLDATQTVSPAYALELPFGVQAGTLPDGSATSCSAFTEVPLLYNVTATFADREVSDASQDGGPSFETVFLPPVSGARSSDIGRTANGSLFWRFTSSLGEGGIAWGMPSAAKNQRPTVVATSLDPYVIFKVEPLGAVYQDSGGTIRLLRFDQATLGPITVGGAWCTALALDVDFSVYCRTESTIIRWTAPSYTFAEVMYQGLLPGSTLEIDDSNDTIYFSTAVGIVSLLRSGAIGSVVTPATVFPVPNVARFIVNDERFFWQANAFVYASPNKAPFSTTLNTAVPPTSDMGFLVRDTTDSTFAWAASPSSIFRVNYNGAVNKATREVVSGLSGIGGVTADTAFVYFALEDGTIRRTRY